VTNVNLTTVTAVVDKATSRGLHSVAGRTLEYDITLAFNGPSRAVKSLPLAHRIC
jgi:hypothetical protein